MFAPSTGVMAHGVIRYSRGSGRTGACLQAFGVSWLRYLLAVYEDFRQDRKIASLAGTYESQSFRPLIYNRRLFCQLWLLRTHP